MGERRAEQRHDAVAHDLIDSALVVMDGIHHQCEDWIDELARVLGIAIGEQPHGALKVGEQHSDLLAFALQVSLGGEDLFGEVLGGVALGGAVPGGGGGRFWGERSRMSAPRTELCCWRQRSAALGAGTPERRCAFLAELRALLIFVAAFRALHQRPQDQPERFVSVAPRVTGNKAMSASWIAFRRVPVLVWGQPRAN